MGTQLQDMSLAFRLQAAPLKNQHCHRFTGVAIDGHQFGSNQGQQFLPGICGLLQAFAHTVGVEVNHLLHHAAQNFFLGFEMMKNTAGLNAHLLGQVPDGGALKALVPE